MLRCLPLLLLTLCLTLPALAGPPVPTSVSGPMPGTLHMAVTDLDGLDEVQSDFGSFALELGRLAGCRVEFYPVFGRVEAVGALKQGRVDLVLTGPAEYVVFRRQTRAVPLVGFLRPEYNAVVVCMTGRGIESMAGLRGGTVALGAVGSTSTHLAPMQVLADGGLDPLKEIKTVHTNPASGWEALKNGSVDALGMSGMSFEDRRDAEPDLPPGAFRVLGQGPDLPNDVLLAGAHLGTHVVERLRRVFAEHGPELKAALLQGPGNAKYRGLRFLPSVCDEDYDVIRRMYGTVGFPAYSDFLGK